MGLESRRSRPKCQQGHNPYRGPRVQSFSSASPWYTPWPHSFKVCLLLCQSLIHTMAAQVQGLPALALSLGSLTRAFLLSSVKGAQLLDEGLLDDLILPWFHQQRRFPDKVTFMGNRVSNLVFLAWGTMRGPMWSWSREWREMNRAQGLLASKEHIRYLLMGTLNHYGWNLWIRAQRKWKTQEGHTWWPCS